MKLNTLLLYLDYVRRKDGIGGTISKPEFNTLLPIVAFGFFKKIFGLPSQYQKGARDPVLGFGLNEISEEKIRPLKVLASTITIDGQGLADYPDDYFHKSAAYYTYSIPAGGTRYIDIPFVNDAKFNERRTTVLDIPSKTDPVGNLHSVKMRFFPVDLDTIYLEYIKYPTTPVMGYAIDIDTAEEIYVENGAYIQILTPGAAGDSITATSGATTFGAYITLTNDTVEDVMKGLMDAINVNTLSHNVKAVYDGVKVVLIDSGTTPYVTLTATATGGVTRTKTDFSIWSVQFDWENDIDAMTDIANMLLDKMGISNRDIPIVQWVEKEYKK